MRSRRWWLTLALATAVSGCGVSSERYYAEVARANKLEIHLRRKLDRIDFLEARDKVAQKQAEQARAADVQRMQQLTEEIARVRAAIHKKERDLSACQTHRPRTEVVPAVRHTARTPGCRHSKISIELGKGPLVHGRGSDAKRARSRLRVAVGRALPGIAACALRAIRRRKRPLRGRLVLALQLDGRGRARRVKTLHNTLRNRRAARCVLKGVRRLRVDRDTGAAFAVVPLRLRTDRVLMSCGVDRSGLGPATISRVIRRHGSEIQLCFISSGLPAKTLRKFRVKVAFTIAANGRTNGVNATSTTPEHAATNTCILRAIQRWRFPKPLGDPPKVTREFRWQRPPRRRHGHHRRRRRRR